MDARKPVSLAETPDRYGAFPRLSDVQMEALAEHGEQRRTWRNEVLFREGDERYDFFVILGGKVAVFDPDGSEEESLIAVHGPRRFLGELGLLTGQAAFFTAVVAEPGEVLVVPVERLRVLVSQVPELGNLILQAYLLRREMLIGLGAGFQIVGSRYSPDARRLREFAARNRLPHRWIDLEEDEAAEALMRQLDVAPEETPVVIWGGRVLRNPSSQELARVIGLQVPSVSEDVYDLLVVGAVSRGSPPPSMGPRRAWRRSRSTRSRRAARLRPPRESRTTSAFRPGSRARSSQIGRSSRRRSSARESAYRLRRPRSSKKTGTTSSGSTTGQRCPPAWS
jgi:thioredoxin reductase (NADPH)